MNLQNYKKAHRLILKIAAMNLPTKIFGGFTIVILLCIMLTYINRRLSEKVDRNMEELTKSEEILKLSSDYQRHIVDMETGCRGFLLGEHKEFLDEYFYANKDIPAILQEASLMVKSNPKQDGKLNYISERLSTWQANFAEPLMEARKKAIAGDDPMAGANYEKLINSKIKLKYDRYVMNDIMAAFKEFDANEYKIRRLKRQELSKSIAETNKISLYVTGFSVALGLLIALLITLHISGRIRKMVALAEKISENDFETNIRDSSRDELGKLSRALNGMSSNLKKSFTELKRTNAELDKFILLASHDIKEPIRMISIYTQLLLRKCENMLGKEENEYADFVQEGVHRIQSLIHDLLIYTQAGRHELNYKIVNCEEIVKSLCTKLKSKIDETGARLIYNGLPQIESDEALLFQLLENLVDNAIKFHKEANPEIIINARRLDTEWLFSIQDNGIGMEQHYEDRVFSVFQRLHERDKYTGTGIGLALCKKIIELHGGRIWFKSNPGEGSIFYFTLPVKITPEVPDNAEEDERSTLAQLLEF
jgi:signal transduction histidine kinase